MSECEACKAARLGLTPRQAEIVRGMADGENTKGIAARLGLSAKTVEYHRAKVYAKLRVDSVAMITRFALKNGLAEM